MTLQAEYDAVAKECKRLRGEIAKFVLGYRCEIKDADQMNSYKEANEKLTDALKAIGRANYLIQCVENERGTIKREAQ